MKKARGIILDADGVVLLNPERFSAKYSREFNIPIEILIKFFQNEFQEVLVGKKDLKALLPRVIPDWQWKGTVDELLEYWFTSEANLNHELIDYIKKLKATGVKIYLATNNEHHRTKYLADNLGFNELFDKIYSSALIGVKKPHKEFYEYILNDSGHSAADLLFFDDDPDNVESANALGIDAHIYKDINSVFDILK